MHCEKLFFVSIPPEAAPFNFILAFGDHILSHN